MQFISFITLFLSFLGLALAQYPEGASVVSSSTETLTRTIRVSQVSTVTSTVTSTSTSVAPSTYTSTNSTAAATTLSPSSTKLVLTASAPVGTGGVAAPTAGISPPIQTTFNGAASAVGAFGAAGAIAMVFAAML